jgi:murein DD-endopeptidase MepM/ murein hydrolase activator NlpD
VQPPAHRVAPAFRGKRAMVATLIAGISVAGVSAAVVSANQVQAAPLSHPRPVPSVPAAPVLASGLAGNASIESIQPPPEPKPTLSAARVRHKVRPRPVVAPTVTWVNPLPEAALTSCFGHRWGRLHAGIDLAAPDGTPIRAAGAGVVMTAGPAQGYGNAVLIDHGNGYLTHYGHLSVITTLPGQRVAAGQVIGLEGSTGNSTGPHLHFEVHRGTYQNPVEPTAWLREHGVTIPGCAPLIAPAEPQA